MREESNKRALLSKLEKIPVDKLSGFISKSLQKTGLY